MSENYATTGIVLAAGGSKRFGQNKLLAMINKKPVLVYSLLAFEKASFVNSVIIVTSENIKSTVKLLVEEYNLLKVKNIILGGKTRQESVRNALLFIKDNDIICPYVAIHDGARPLVMHKNIDQCIQGAVKHKAVALGMRPKDTIKQSNSAFSKTIHSTPPRDHLWAIQTPQAFDFDLIYEAHIKAYKNGFVSTDDSALVENIGVNPEIIEGDYRNLKITTPEDIDIAAVLLKEEL